MKFVRGRVPWLAAALALAVAGGAVAAVLLEGGSNVRRVLPPGRALEARGTLSTREASFGDTVDARVDVRLDRNRFDAGRVRLITSFDPYQVTAPPDVQRWTVGGVTEVVTTYRLRCLVTACLDVTGGRRRIQFRAAQLRYGSHTTEVSFPDLLLSSRLAAREVQINPLVPELPRLRAETRSLPAPSWRVAPAPLSSGLLVAAAVLLLGAAALGYRLLPESVRTFGRTRPPALPPVERALALLEQARRSGREVDERKALDLLARELLRRGAGELAGAARELAWSRTAPPERATDELADEVRGLLTGAANGRRHG